jgi:hypothetical protein
MKKTAIVVLTYVCLVLSACMSLNEKAGKIIDGSAFAEKTAASYRSENGTLLSEIRFKDGRIALKLTVPAEPALAFYLLPAGETGSYTLSFCTFFASSIRGWNEFTLDLSGTGHFEGKERYRLMLENIEETGISSGRIRAGENRLSGDGALYALRNRKDRIEAVAAWMKKNARADPPEFQNEKEFDAWWKPVLLPEVTAKRKRPADYTAGAGALSGADGWIRAEDVKWNAAWSAGFPEDIAMLRNTGALLRDWEEALLWIYLSYRWEGIINSITGELYFEKTK